MKKFFSVGQTAKAAGITAETLRHYDRIGLVKPCKTDEWTGYRYYSEGEIVRLQTVKALRCMDLSLAEIKEILEYDDFEKIVTLLKRAEKSAESKIAELEYAKAKIERARSFYEGKLRGKTVEGVFVKAFPKRVILLSDTLEQPSTENLWEYHRHFYKQLGEDGVEDFSFEDSAGIYECKGVSRLFAVCTKYRKIEGIKILPAGNYLCADCTEENRSSVFRKLLASAQSEYNAAPKFSVQLIVLSGILQWSYQIQIPL